jgi:hypothetical protein
LIKRISDNLFSLFPTGCYCYFHPTRILIALHHCIIVLFILQPHFFYFAKKCSKPLE